MSLIVNDIRCFERIDSNERDFVERHRFVLIATVHFRIAILLTERAARSGIMIMLLERLYLRKLFYSSLKEKKNNLPPVTHCSTHSVNILHINR